VQAWLQHLEKHEQLKEKNLGGKGEDGSQRQQMPTQHTVANGTAAAAATTTASAGAGVPTGVAAAVVTVTVQLLTLQSNPLHLIQLETAAECVNASC